MLLAQPYQSFITKEEMDTSVFLHVKKHQDELTDSARKVLHFLQKSACGVVGVSWPLRETIAKKTGVSLPSVSRATRALEKANIIRKVQTTRKRGGDGTVLYVILPFDDKAADKAYDKAENQATPLQNQEFKPPIQMGQTISKTKSFEKSLKENQNYDDKKGTTFIPSSLNEIEQQVCDYALKFGILHEKVNQIIIGLHGFTYTFNQAKAVIHRAVRYYGQQLEGASNIPAVFAAAIKRELSNHTRKPAHKQKNSKLHSSKHGGNATTVSFEEAKQMEIENKRKRAKHVDVVPAYILEQKERDKNREEAIQKARDAERTQESFEDRLRNIQAMLNTPGELWLPDNTSLPPGT